MKNALIKKLREYFKHEENVLMAFLFGSQAKGATGKLSDWDIAVYFRTSGNDNPAHLSGTMSYGSIELEKRNKQYPGENRIWGGLIDILQTDNVDLIVLNRAPAGIAASAIKGVPLAIKDHGLYLDFMLLSTRESEDFNSFIEDYYAISQRAQSLHPQERQRLIKTIDFLEKEMALYSYFLKFSRQTYENEILKRHEVEKWVENIIIAVIDISKIIAGSRKKPIPDTYREAVSQAFQILKFPDTFINRFDQWIRLRNIVVHEYLDIKWQRIFHFIQNSEPYLKKISAAVKKLL